MQSCTCSWDTFTIDNLPVTASCGLNVDPDTTVSSIEKKINNYDAVFVCSAQDVKALYSNKLKRLLQSIVSSGKALGSISTGTYLLARAGLLNGYKCTVHWDIIAMMREEFPRLILNDDIYQIDRDRYTCSGGLAATDLMLYLIGQKLGQELISDISDMFMLHQSRTMSDSQRIPLRHLVGSGQPKLKEIVMLMESNIEETLQLDEISRYVKISRRQIERLFQEHLNTTPTKYYTRLRLKHARHLLMNTSLPIIEVAVQCGFSSGSYFSKCYQLEYGCVPSEDRKIRSKNPTDFY